MHDDETSRGFKLPHRDNNLQVDVERLRDAITAISEAFDAQDESVGPLIDAAIAESRGAAAGIAPLDSSVKIPESYLPAVAEKTSNKDVANGYAGLGTDGKLSGGVLPSTVEKTSNKNTANGYAGLGTDGKLPDGVLPDTVEKTGNKGIENGYAALGADGKVPSGQLPDYLLKAGGTMAGALIVQNNTNYSTAQARNVTMSTTDLTAGSSALASGQIYLVYE
jgi:hypothetical protein